MLTVKRSLQVHMERMLGLGRPKHLVLLLHTMQNCQYYHPPPSMYNDALLSSPRVNASTPCALSDTTAGMGLALKPHSSSRACLCARVLRIMSIALGGSLLSACTKQSKWPARDFE